MRHFFLLSLSLRLFMSTAAPIATSKARCFPSDFRFGTAHAAFQEEGGAFWNVSHRFDANCQSKSNLHCNNVTDACLHHYRDDVQWISDMGMSLFQFSISWSRVMTWNGETGRMQPDPQGIASYHALLDALQRTALQPMATLSHVDLPLMLQTQGEPHGWLNPDIVSHFEDFAKLVFYEFGTKVKYWATFDDPLRFISSGCGLQDAAPGDFEPSDTNTYTVAHNVLRSHARAVAMFRALKGGEQGGVDAGARIGIVLNAEFGYPLNASDALDVKAAERKMYFDLGWFLMPIVTGDYPEIMRERVGERLPRFSSEEAALIKGSYDVFMVKNYHLRLVTNCDSEHSEISCNELPQGHARDRGIDNTRAPNGSCMSPASSPGLADYPDGYLATIKWLHEKDPSTDILLAENNWCRNDQINNLDQLRYFQVYVEQVYKAIVEEKIPIIGYTWLLNNTERASDNLTSHSTQELRSAKWFAHLLATKCLAGWDQSTIEMDVGEQQEAAAPRDKMLNPEAGGNDVGVPWSLSEVIILIIVGVVLLGAITCEAIRALRMSSQGSPEEVQVLITIED